ncbi:hypothetical protein ARMGADRAFT_1040328 [Armillaria gallica]|uniref:Uncharacterized protein n=1 Tax=Armillaria gallica TaxID=47427 RepID=A0A2H3CTI5_ARMGA|nr:hypothetical protein ARMGADRAFT_1040328 [Armillaria gallica]
MLEDPPMKQNIICSLSLFFGNPIWNLFNDLEVAKTLNRTICTKDLVLYFLQFEAIVSYIANSVSPSFGWDDPDSITHAFVYWNKKSLFMNILQVIKDHQLYSSSFLGISQAYEAFQGSDHLGYLVRNSQLHLEIMEGLYAYITGISEATKKTGKLPDIESTSFLKSISKTSINHLFGTTAHPMLSSFALIAPDHTQWSQILETLNSPSHEYSIDKYTSSSYDRKNNGKFFKKDLKKTVAILAECLEGERDRKNLINQQSTSSNRQTGPPEIQRGFRWPTWMRKSWNMDGDVELQVHKDERE